MPARTLPLVHRRTAAESQDMSVVEPTTGRKRPPTLSPHGKNSSHDDNILANEHARAERVKPTTRVPSTQSSAASAGFWPHVAAPHNQVSPRVARPALPRTIFAGASEMSRTSRLPFRDSPPILPRWLRLCFDRRGGRRETYTPGRTATKQTRSGKRTIAKPFSGEKADARQTYTWWCDSAIAIQVFVLTHHQCEFVDKRGTSDAWAGSG